MSQLFQYQKGSNIPNYLTSLEIFLQYGEKLKMNLVSNFLSKLVTVQLVHM